MRSVSKPEVFAVAFIAVVGNLMLSILPGFVGALIDYAHLTQAHAGVIASINLLGTALGALTASFLLMRFPLQSTVAVGLWVMLGAELCCAFVEGPNLLALLRLASGAAGGFVASTCIGAFARMEKPQVGYAAATLLQFIGGGVCLVLLPAYLPRSGMPGLYLLFCGLIACCLAALPFQRVLRHQASLPSESVGMAARGVVLVLVAYALFQGGLFTAWTYMDRIGLSTGLSAAGVGAALGLGGGLLGMLGAGLAGAVGMRIGVTTPIVAGVVLIVVSLAAVVMSNSSSVFFVANVAVGFGWAFATPYFLTSQAFFDPGGRVAALGTFVALVGIAAGPALAAFCVTPGSYQRSVWVGSAELIASAALVLASKAKDNARQPAARLGVS